MMNTLFTYLNKPIYKHILFWIAVFSFYIAVNRVHYNSTEELLTINFLYLLFQTVTSYTIIYFIIPHYKKHKNILLSIIIAFTFFVVLNIIYVSWQAFFYAPESNNCYWRLQQNHGHLPFLQQVWGWKEDFAGLFWIFMQPTFFLIPFLWYEKNLKLSVANEQKKVAELAALKNQLNPHFLFNTLNNLYSLALEKSEKTPEVIERLSDILDYILYRCKYKYVPLEKEVELIDNYLSLEKVRYGKRVDIQFKKSIKNNKKIAPLILLTFIENAFKHGVKQELKKAKITIDLTTQNDSIIFIIKNTKPITKIASVQEPLGLKNVQKQLVLLYPETHNLQISDTQREYSVTLTLKQQ